MLKPHGVGLSVTPLPSNQHTLIASLGVGENLGTQLKVEGSLVLAFRWTQLSVRRGRTWCNGFVTSGFAGTMNFSQGDSLVGILKGKACPNPLAACWAGALGVGYPTPCAREPHVHSCACAHVHSRVHTHTHTHPYLPEEVKVHSVYPASKLMAQQAWLAQTPSEHSWDSGAP